MSARPALASDITRWKHNLQCEVDGAHIYRAMAANAGDEAGTIYAEMADAEGRHADLWRGRLAAGSRFARSAFVAGAGPGLHGAPPRGGLVAPTIASGEREGRTMYDDQPEAAGTAFRRTNDRMRGTCTG